ncbi:MAG: V-type ATP synthase subunit F [Anaerolineaceae bacterium]|nr:V-type ATP synthase subunit F [Anaerolineaceae bacterium]
MKVRVIGHPEAVQGFALVGVQGEIASNPEAVHAALDRALEIPDVGIILITNDAAAMAKNRIDQLKFHSEIPLVVEIPGPNPDEGNQVSLNEMIERAIGIKIK